MARRFPSVVIENVQPLIDGGRYPIKRIVGEDLAVEADIFKDGHDVVAAVLKWRVVGKRAWRETPMIFVDNDRWRGVCTLYDEAIHEYTVEAWTDTFRSWHKSSQRNLRAAFLICEAKLWKARHLWKLPPGGRGIERMPLVCANFRSKSHRRQFRNLRHREVRRVGSADGEYPDRSAATQYAPAPRVVVDRPAALFAAWYEFFPRSAEGLGDRGSTFRDCLPRVDDAKAMGFDVIYFPPIHPIGHTNRKGKNNSITCEPGDPGVPWAIGSEAGGHKAVEPSLRHAGGFRLASKRSAQTRNGNCPGFRDQLLA